MSVARRELVRALGHVFRDENLLTRALTHRSRGSTNNERLEFLGDSILNFLVADLLYDRYPELPEGDLTRLRAALVRRETLAMIARDISLGDCLELGGGELKSGGFDRDSILADALEAVIGAIYKEAGVEAARQVLHKLFAGQLAAIQPGIIQKDPKTRLQEYLQARALELPFFRISAVAGTGLPPLLEAAWKVVAESRAASMVNAASCAVLGRPSCQRSPGCRWNVSVVPASPHDQRRAQYGTTCSAESCLTSVTKSAWRCTCRANGWTVTSGLPDSRSEPEA